MFIRREVKAAVFDLWQTLIHTDSVDSASVWQKHTGVSREAISRAINRHEHAFMAGRLSLAKWPYRVAETAGITLTERRASLIRCDLQELWIRESRPYPGTHELLEALRARGIKTAVCSNANPFTREVIRHYFGGVLDVMVVSCNARLCKPNPRIFERALARLGVRAEDAVYSGDGAHREIPAAKSIGFHTVLVRHEEGWVTKNPSDDPGPAADTSVRAISDLFSVLTPGQA
jgi:HAD superfamily hydrolase (TIGR01509 family)